MDRPPKAPLATETLLEYPSIVLGAQWCSARAMVVQTTDRETPAISKSNAVGVVAHPGAGHVAGWFCRMLDSKLCAAQPVQKECLHRPSNTNQPASCPALRTGVVVVVAGVVVNREQYSV